MAMAMALVVARREPRTLQQVQGDHKYVAPPGDLSPGPWQTKDLAVAAIRIYGLDQQRGGGTFSVVQARGVEKATLKLGRRLQLECDHSGQPQRPRKETLYPATQSRSSKKCACTWRLTLEETNSGWTISRGCFEHANHTLVKTTTPRKRKSHANSAIAQPSQRSTHTQTHTLHTQTHTLHTQTQTHTSSAENGWLGTGSNTNKL